MEPLLKFRLSILHILFAATIFLLTDARFFNDDENFKYPEALESVSPLVPPNGNPYGLPSPLSPPPLPSLPPLPSPALIPPSPPFTPPSTPSLMVPPPLSFNFPIKSPPLNFTPKPTKPPSAVPGPSPPSAVPGLSPPSAFPGPSPPTPALPPPEAASPPHKKPQSGGMWCVAKPTVPDLVIQGALDYACGSGADCKSIQPNGPCFQPNTLMGHASYAFNSYWQSTKESGGTCDFGGTAMLVTADPSYSKCNFIFK